MIINYITEDFYKDNGGLTPPDNLDKYIKRASADVFRLILLDMEEFETLTDKQKYFVQMATVAQTEYLINGGLTASSLSSQADSIAIGSYSESKFAANADSNGLKGFADTVYEWLINGGFISAVVGSRHSNWSGDNIV